MRATGSIVVYATNAGSTASDNPNERNGLFTKNHRRESKEEKI